MKSSIFRYTSPLADRLDALLAIIIILCTGLMVGCWGEPDYPAPPAPAPAPGPAPGPTPGPGPVPPDPNPGPGPPAPGPTPDLVGESVTINKIVDGDTFTVRMKGAFLPITIHVYGVDAPEADQEFGDRSKAYLEDLISQTSDEVTLQIVGDDSRRSKTAWVGLSNGWIYNYEVVRTGWAWERDSGVPELVKLADEARMQGYGIWQSAVSKEPWVWRQSMNITEEEDKNVYDEPIGDAGDATSTGETD